MEAERGLLLAVMAVQLGLLEPRQVMQAAAAWAADRRRGLAEHLGALGALNSAHHRMITAMVEEAVRAHKGDAGAALATLGGARVVEETFGGSLVLEPDGTVTPLPVAGEAGLEDTWRVTREHAGRYQPSGAAPRELGRGGLGRVLLALDGHIGREVAVKEMLTGPSLDQAGARMSTALARFLREARVTGQLEHPNIVPVYELGRRADGTLYYTMKVVRGRTLAEALSGAAGLRGRLGLLKHFVDLCQAVAYAHARGVVHRDLKPSNVMVGEFGETVVLDWGLAKMRGQADLRGEELRQAVRDLGQQDSGATVAGSAVGTPAYMSPEQAEGRLEAIDERSDVWGLGAVLFEILTGAPPFQGLTVFEVMGQVLRARVPDPLQRCPEAPAELASVCLKALQRDSARRYQSARQLAEEVQAYLVGGRVRAYDYRLGELLRRFAARHKGVLSVAAAGLLLLAGLGVYSYSRVVDERDQANLAREEARGRLAETLLEGSQAAVDDRDFWSARARLRSALEIDDSLRARGLWMRLAAEPERWSATVDSIPNDLDVSPDGRGLAVTLESGRVLWFGLADRRPRQIAEHGAAGFSLSFSPDGRELASGSVDGQIQFTSLETGRIRLSLSGATAYVLRHHPAGGLLARVAHGRGVELVDVSTGTVRALLALPVEEGAMQLAFSADGSLLACGTTAGKVHLWRWAGARELASLALDWRGGLDFDPRGGWLAAGCGRDVCLLEPRSGEVMERLQGHAGEVTALSAAGDGTLASAGRNYSIMVWRPRSSGPPSGPAEELLGHESTIGALALSPDGQLLASVSDDLTVRTWDLGHRGRLRDRGHLASVSFGDFSPDGRRLATAGEDRTLRLWDVSPGAQLHVLRGHESVYCATYSADGRMVASTGGDQSLRLWDAQLGTQLLNIHAGGANLTELAIEPGGRWVATAGREGAIRVWSASQGLLLREYKEQGFVVEDLASSPDGGLLAAGCSDGAVRIWSPAQVNPAPRVLQGWRGSVSGIVFTPDGRGLLATDRSGALRRFDLAGAGGIQTLAERPVGLAGLRIHPSGHRVAVGQQDGEMWTLDLEGGAPQIVPATRGLPLDITDDFRLAASALEAGGVQVWDVETGRPMWRTVGLFPDGSLLSHRGCERLPELAPCPPAEAEGRWFAAVLTAARADRAPGRGLGCLQTFDGALEIWDLRKNERLASRQDARVERLWALAGGCALLGEGRLAWLAPDGGLREIASGIQAAGPDRDGLLVQAGQEVLWLEPAGRVERIDSVASAEGSALARLPGGLALGLRGGGISLSRAGEAPRLLLSPKPGRVTALAAGPGGSLLAGRDTGWLELWDPGAGRMLDQIHLHGAVLHLRVQGGWAWAATELGDAQAWDLRDLTAERCDLLRRVWREVPVIWDGGQAVPASPPAGHTCLEPGGLAAGVQAR